MFTKALVRTILEKATEYKWSLQGLGMLRLYLTDEIRLHVWDSRYRIPNVSPLHTHPWHFDSSVVAGKVTQKRFLAFNSKYGATAEPYNCATIKCGKDACVMDDTTTVWLLPIYEEYAEGTSYRQDKDEIHESLPLDGTVTIVERYFSADRDHAKVFWKGNGGFVSAEPRTATAEEVKNITSYALWRWFGKENESAITSSSRSA